MAEPCSLELAPEQPNVGPELWTPGNGREAEFGALVVTSVFPEIDKGWVEDMLTAQQEFMGSEWGVDTSAGESVIVGVTIGKEDNKGSILIPARAIDGYNALTQSNGNPVPSVYYWKEMYNNRPPSWWNMRRPNGESSQIVAEPFVLGVLSNLLDTNRTWEEQQEGLKARITTTPKTATEAATPMDMLMRDAAARVSGATSNKPQDGIGRLDTETFTRFVQHKQDIMDSDTAYGPSSYVAVGQFNLHRSNGLRNSYFGSRVLRGQRAPEA